MEPCTSNHEQIMAELASIKQELSSVQQKMKDDWVLIKESHNDLQGRMYLYSIIKFIGFTGTVYIITHFT